jgi:hypothetical protein
MLKCKFFHWAGGSPSTSPSTMQTATMSAPTPAAIVDLLVPVGDGMCAHPDCQTTRLAPGCVNKQCWRHCRLLGNCNFKSHIVNTSALVPTALAATSWNSYIPSQGSVSSTTTTSLCPQPLTATLSVPQATTSLDVDTNSNFFSSQGFIPSAAPSSSMSVPRTAALTFRSLDARPDPHFTSQIQDVFSTEWGVQQGLVASKREREAERLENIRRANMEVTVHAQIKVSNTFTPASTILILCSERRRAHSFQIPRWICTSLL